MRSVVVTGGVRRLGKAIADHLAVRGWRVVRTSHRADAGADIVADLAAPGGADALWAAACAHLGGPPDALVNNAALYIGADADATRRVNVEAPKRLIERMTAARGRVVSILDAHVARHAGSAYAQSKAALADLVRRGGGCGVAVGDVVGLAPEGRHEKAAPAPLGRPTPEDVARAVASLLDAPAVADGTVICPTHP